MINVTRKSEMSGKEHTRALPLSPEEFDAAHRRWEAGEYIQNAFPTLSADDREFLMTGITPEEWEEFLGPDPDEYYLEQELENEPRPDENGWTEGWWAGGTAWIHSCGNVDPTGDERDAGTCTRCNTEAPPSEPQPFDDDLPF